MRKSQPLQMQHTCNHKEHREHKETADQAQIGNFSAFFAISVVKNQATFETAEEERHGAGARVSLGVRHVSNSMS
jgi:hypothetical protein